MNKSQEETRRAIKRDRIECIHCTIVRKLSSTLPQSQKRQYGICMDNRTYWTPYQS